MYSSLGLAPAHIYIVGRPVKKLSNQCQVWWRGWRQAGAAGDNCRPTSERMRVEAAGSDCPVCPTVPIRGLRRPPGSAGGSGPGPLAQGTPTPRAG